MQKNTKFLSKCILFLTVFLVLSTMIFASGEEKIKVFIDNKEISFDVDPIIIEDRTMVPFRKIFEVYEFNVDWVEATRTILAKKGDKTIVLQLDNKKSFVNQKSILLEVAPQLIDNRTMVPLRFVSESIGATVVWVEATNTVNITSQANAN